MYSCQRKHRHTVARRKPETFASRSTKGDFNECCIEFYKAKQEVGTRVERQISGRFKLKTDIFMLSSVLTSIHVINVTDFQVVFA